jgi:acetoin utilization protein AcuC
MRERASGFCVFNDPAIAIQRLRRTFDRIAYIDVDAHHGDGVEAAFYDSSDVLTISIHESGHFLFPGSGFTDEIGVGAGRGYSVNIPLTPSTPDEVYLWAFDEIVPPLIEAYDPEIVVAQLGVDSHFQDPLARLALTSHGFTAIIERILGLGRPLVALGGGGYNLAAVPRLWTLAYGLMSERQIPDRIPPEYATKYGITHLHDTTQPGAAQYQRHNVRPDAERAVRDIKRLVFPFHGLSSE